MKKSEFDKSFSGPVFEYYAPTVDYKDYLGIVSIPHSGLEIPEETKKFLTDDQVKLDKDVDFGVHHLVDIQKLRESGIAVIKSNIHRTAIDLNRAKEVALLNWKNNSHGEKIVINEPSLEEQEDLLAKYYVPYYQMLGSFLNELSSYKNKTIPFIDLHSMPSKATEYHLKQKPDQPIDRPDFCLSDFNGETCEKEFIEFAKSELERHQFQVKINDPYIGGHITQYFSKNFNIKNIQIEIKRDVYMDEVKRVLVKEKSDKLLPKLTSVLVDIFEKFQ